MGKRGDALWRIVALLWVSTVGYILALVIGTVAFVWGVVDVLWQLIVGRDGLSASSRPAMLVDGTFKWLYGQNVYFFTGGGAGKFQALPSMG